MEGCLSELPIIVQRINTNKCAIAQKNLSGRSKTARLSMDAPLSRFPHVTYESLKKLSKSTKSRPFQACQSSKKRGTEIFYFSKHPRNFFFLSNIRKSVRGSVFEARSTSLFSLKHSRGYTDVPISAESLRIQLLSAPDLFTRSKGLLFHASHLYFF